MGSYKAVIDAFTGQIVGSRRRPNVNQITDEQRRGEIAQLMSKGGTTTLQPFMNNLIMRSNGRISREDAYMAAMNAFKNLYPKMMGEAKVFGMGQQPILGSYKKGTSYVPQTGNYTLHKGEAVIPSNINNELAALMREQVGVERDQRIKEREAKAVMKQLTDAIMGNAAAASSGGTMDLTGGGTNTETGVGTLAEGVGDPNALNYAPAGQEMLIARGMPDTPQSSSATSNPADANTRKMLLAQAVYSGVIPTEVAKMLGGPEKKITRQATKNERGERVWAFEDGTPSNIPVADRVPNGFRETATGDFEPVPGGPADIQYQQKQANDQAAYLGLSDGLDRMAKTADQLLTENKAGLKRIAGMSGAVPLYGNRWTMPGTEGANAKARLETLKAKVGFEVLQQMRLNSKTGGALGQVSDMENKLLQQAIDSLDTAQTDQQLTDAVSVVRDTALKIKKRYETAYRNKWEGRGITGKQLPEGMSEGWK